MECKLNRNFVCTGFLLANFMLVSVIQASELSVKVTDTEGALLKEAVVYLEGENIGPTKHTPVVEISQKRKKFNPLVTVIQAGTSVNFPNLDRVRHHVYSFSPAKKFELKLYSGVPAKPVTFDQAGTVILGCNIHDNMLAFIYIVNTPYFAQTDSNGIAKFADVPAGNYEVKTWHYALKKENTPVAQPMSISEANNKLSIALEINDAAIVSSK